ncbi:hypothetical protein HaLaN_15544, partial [Haematococcus lacustris]
MTGNRTPGLHGCMVGGSSHEAWEAPIQEVGSAVLVTPPCLPVDATLAAVSLASTAWTQPAALALMNCKRSTPQAEA